MLFRVYYSEYAHQETFDGNLDNVDRTPVDEVLLIVQYDQDHGRKLVSGGDFYYWDEKSRWISCDQYSLYQYLRRPGFHRFLLGVMVHSDEWNRVMKFARTDPDFPPQTALHTFESKEHF